MYETLVCCKNLFLKSYFKHKEQTGRQTNKGLIKRERTIRGKEITLISEDDIIHQNGFSSQYARILYIYCISFKNIFFSGHDFFMWKPQFSKKLFNNKRRSLRQKLYFISLLLKTLCIEFVSKVNHRYS